MIINMPVLIIICAVIHSRLFRRVVKNPAPMPGMLTVTKQQLQVVELLLTVLELDGGDHWLSRWLLAPLRSYKKLLEDEIAMFVKFNPVVFFVPNMVASIDPDQAHQD